MSDLLFKIDYSCVILLRSGVLISLVYVLCALVELSLGTIYSLIILLVMLL